MIKSPHFLQDVHQTIAYCRQQFIWKHRGDLKVLQVSQNPKHKNYVWHRLVYTAIIPIPLLAILSGLAMYKPDQLH
ncbi:hypothetical protein [Nostoc sp. ChiQUE01b]|uniref:hypothetical protein n=1 Tax=Nostoc sp. ChiQUE01b TaxID=3075376 RepID=UPI002AD48413|nr:hypothetical protein [Nostoc sp. ChiQUE01b]MDZ8258341.1 hypothetical protein [Nostoc sp. ChiQUE01b]